MPPPSLVVLTGAGISAESGLATFRDAGGVWATVRIEDVATPEAFRRDPDRVHEFYNLRRAQARDPKVRPNPAHEALARLEREGLTPSPEADRATLLRRVSLDLIGLPPTPAELEAFLADLLVGLVCWAGGHGAAARPWEARCWEARPWFLHKYWALLGGEAEAGEAEGRAEAVDGEGRRAQEAPSLACRLVPERRRRRRRHDPGRDGDGGDDEVHEHEQHRGREPPARGLQHFFSMPRSAGSGAGFY